MMKLIARRPARWTLMAVATLVLISVPVVAQIQFSDVESDNPHWDDIVAVARERWFLGYADGSYKPDKNISPSEMAKVLSRAFDEGITRAEFASFMVAGNQWIQSIKSVPNFKNWAMGNNGLIRRFFIGFNKDNAHWWWWDDDNNSYINPGRYRIQASTNSEWGGWGRGALECKWMRLGSLPDGGQNYDTIELTDAPLVGYFQAEYTREAHIIEIEPTDYAFWYKCQRV